MQHHFFVNPSQPFVNLNGNLISGNTLVIAPDGTTYIASDLAASRTFPAAPRTFPAAPHTFPAAQVVIGNPYIGIGNPVLMSHQPIRHSLPSHPLNGNYNDISPFGLQPIAPRVKDYRNM